MLNDSPLIHLLWLSETCLDSCFSDESPSTPDYSIIWHAPTPRGHNAMGLYVKHWEVNWSGVRSVGTNGLNFLSRLRRHGVWWSPISPWTEHARASDWILFNWTQHRCMQIFSTICKCQSNVQMKNLSHGNTVATDDRLGLYNKVLWDEMMTLRLLQQRQEG